MIDFSKFKKEGEKHFFYLGYCNNAKNQYPEFPFPVEQEKRDVRKDIERLDFILNHAATKKVFMKGFSICRICEELNGTLEYWIPVGKNYFVVIPDGYKHYIEEHYIIMDDMVNQVFYFLDN